VLAGVRLFLLGACAVGALGLTGCSLLHKKSDDPLAEMGGEPSFELQVQSPNSDLRTLLQDHLDLQRYRHLPDLSDGEINSLMAQAHQDAANLLATQGYFNPQISVQRQDAAGPSAGGQKRPTIVVQVEPGPATTVSAVKLQFKGQIADSLDLPQTIQRRIIRQFWQLKKGQRFSQTRWDAAKDRALRDLTADRYLAGKLGASSAQIDADDNQAQLHAEFDSGPTYHFGPTVVQGNVNYDTTMIQRFVRLPEGDDYSLTRLLQAQQRLVDTGFFDSVFLYMDPKADPAATPVQVQVSEAKLQKIVLGVGASTNYGGRLSVEHVDNISPFFGWRSQIKTSFDKQQVANSLNLLSQPDAQYWRWSLGAAYTRDVDQGQTTRSQTWSAGRLQNNENIDRSIDVEYNRSTLLVIDPSTLLAGYQTSAAYSANWAWTARHFDSQTFPTDGYGFGAEVGAGMTSRDAQGRQDPFLRLVGRWQSYHPLDDLFPPRPGEKRPESWGRIALRGQLGAVVAKPNAPVPAKLLFLTGGDGSVRGYPYRSISAQTISYNGQNYPMPGNYLVVGSAEWQRPIYIDGARSDWESAVFVDVGDVAYTVKDLHMQTGVGVGARWHSPIGPFQADLAYGVQRKQFRLNLSVGFAF